MAEYWAREVKRASYYKERFDVRLDQYNQNKAKREQQEALELAKESGKQDDKKDDEFDVMEKEYQEFAKAYIKENILKEEVAKDDKKKDDKKK